jgi:NADPH:quinone reductase
VKVGDGVTEFKEGDRVAAFHEIGEAAGSFAEYALAWAYTTFHIPASTSFEEASTIPLVSLTAVVALYHDLALPDPWSTAAATDKPDPWKSLSDSNEGVSVDETPLVIYGASSGVGAAAVQLARLSNIHPIIAVAGQSTAFVETLLDKSKGDVVVDYRGGDDAAVAALKKAVGDRKVFNVVNAISEGSSNYIVSQVLQPDGRVTLVLPWKDDARIKTKVHSILTSVGRVHRDLKDLGFVYSRYFGRVLQQGTFKGHPYEVVPGGLAGVQTGLTNLREGKAHGIKYVFRIADTEDAGKDKL